MFVCVYAQEFCLLIIHKQVKQITKKSEGLVKAHSLIFINDEN